MKKGRSSIVSLMILLLLLPCLVSCEKEIMTPDESQMKTPTVSSTTTLKQGLTTLLEIYNHEGEQAAATFASESGLSVENGKVHVHLYTEGNDGAVYVEDLKSLGVTGINPSQHSNVISAFVPLSQLEQIAALPFVRYITPPPEIHIQP